MLFEIPLCSISILLISSYTDRTQKLLYMFLTHFIGRYSVLHLSCVRLHWLTFAVER